MGENKNKPGLYPPNKSIREISLSFRNVRYPTRSQMDVKISINQSCKLAIDLH